MNAVAQGRRWSWTALGALVALALAVGLAERMGARWPTDNRIASWALRGEESERLRRFHQRFGGDESVQFRLDGLSESSPQAWELAARLASRQARSPAVEAALDPFRLPDLSTLSREAGSEEPGARLEEQALSATDARARLERARERPVVEALDLADADLTRVDWLLAVRPSATPDERRELVQLLEHSAREAEAAGLEPRYAGHPVLTAALDAEAKRVEKRFTPLLVIVALVCLALVLRSLGLALAVVLLAALAATGVRAGLLLVGWPSNMILVAAGPLALVLQLAGSLHFVNAFRCERFRGHAPASALRRGRRHVMPALVLAAATTSLGFAVFATSRIEAVRRLGTAVAVTVLAAALLGVLVLSIVLSGYAGASAKRRSERNALSGRRIVRFALARRGPVLVLGIVTISLGIGAAWHLEQSTNALDFFPNSSRVRADFVGLERDGAPLSTVELIGRLELSSGDHVAPSPSEVLEFWDDAMPVRLLRETQAERVFGPELVRSELEALLGSSAATGLTLAPALKTARRYDAESGLWRWSVGLSTTGTGELIRRTREIEAVARRVARDRASARGDVIGQWSFSTTGSLPAALAMQGELLSTLASSLALAICVGSALFAFVVRSLRELGVVLATNLLPVAFVVLASAVLGWKLDAATVMVAAVVYGLGVDNTMHLFVAAGGRGRSRARPLRSILRAFDRVTPPALQSALALALGFAALGLSGFAPTAHFGILVSLGVLAAAWADLVLLPALWIRSARLESTPRAS